MTILPNGARAVMASRVEPPDSLEYFPTPPWATRALVEHVLCRHTGRHPSWSPLSLLDWTALDPCCGEGHMVEPLRESFDHVFGSDIHDYGAGFPVADVLDPAYRIPAVDWVITNPPFGLAADIVTKCLDAPARGVAVLVRLAWVEGGDRFKRLFKRRPPHILAPFVERVPMVKGRWDPTASTATAYAWVVWVRGVPYGRTDTIWIPPCRDELHRQSDVERWCAPAPMPLFEGVVG